MNDPAFIGDLALQFCDAIDPRIRKPNTIYHVGISGGKDSDAALLWMINESGIPKSQIRASFCDTKNEHDWTYQQVKMLNETVHPIETLEPELGFYELALDKHRFPSTKARFCTEHLKILPTQRHIEKLKYEGFEVVAVSGVRTDESEDRRLLTEWAFAPILKCFQWRPLIRWTLADVLAIHSKYKVPMNPLYALGAMRVGCYPCIMSRKSEIRTIALKCPEQIDKIRAAELEFVKVYGRFSSFFPPNICPERFRSMRVQNNDGSFSMISTIDDVVKWSMTGDRAQGSWEDSEQPESIGCSSGYCE